MKAQRSRASMLASTRMPSGAPMKTSRRQFLELSGASAGAAALAGSAPDVAFAASADPRVASLQQYFAANAQRYLALPPVADEIPRVSVVGPLSPPSTLPAGVIYPLSDPLIAGPTRQHWRASLPGNPLLNGFPCLAITRN